MGRGFRCRDGGSFEGTCFRSHRDSGEGGLDTLIATATLHAVHHASKLSSFKFTMSRTMTTDASDLLVPHARLFTVGFVLRDPPAPAVLVSVRRHLES